MSYFKCVWDSPHGGTKPQTAQLVGWIGHPLRTNPIVRSLSMNLGKFSGGIFFYNQVKPVIVIT